MGEGAAQRKVHSGRAGFGTSGSERVWRVSRCVGFDNLEHRERQEFDTCDRKAIRSALMKEGVNLSFGNNQINLGIAFVDRNREDDE